MNQKTSAEKQPPPRYSYDIMLAPEPDRYRGRGLRGVDPPRPPQLVINEALETVIWLGRQVWFHWISLCDVNDDIMKIVYKDNLSIMYLIDK